MAQHENSLMPVVIGVGLIAGLVWLANRNKAAVIPATATGVPGAAPPGSGGATYGTQGTGYTGGEVNRALTSVGMTAVEQAANAAENAFSSQASTGGT